jgi:3-(3-hydroxy-phenyl)propionate hydroxylase
MSTPHTYTPSTLCLPDAPSENWGNVPGPGAKPPDAAVSLIRNGQEEATFLRRLFGSGFVLLFFEEDPAQAAETHRALESARAASLPLTIYTITHSRAGHTAALHDPQGHLAALFGARPGAMLLFRPDGHMALRRQHANPHELAGYFQSLCGSPNDL